MFLGKVRVDRPQIDARDVDFEANAFNARWEHAGSVAPLKI